MALGANECNLSPLCYDATAVASDVAREQNVLKKRGGVLGVSTV